LGSSIKTAASLSRDDVVGGTLALSSN